MPAVALSPILNGWQGLTLGGLPLSGGFINTYQAGTSTPVATYTTNAGSVANANPIILGPDGRPPQEIWLIQGQAYRFTVTDSLSNPMATYDNITGVDSGANTLRTDLAASSGSSLVGFIQAGSGAVARTSQSKMRDTVNIKDFGAPLDGSTDDGSAINLAINHVLYSLGGGVVEYPSGSSSKITTKILIPSGVVLDLNSSRIVGGGIGFGTPMFESAYDNSGTITTNIGTTPETHVVLGSGVIGRGATITNSGTVFNLFDFLDNSFVEGIEFQDCTKPVYAKNCFYMTLRKLFSRGTASASAEPAFQFDGFNNTITIESVFVVGRALGFKFDGGTYGLKISNVSAESCTTGMQFRGTVHALTFSGGCFFESTTTALDFGGAGPSFVGIDIDGCWFNLCTTAITGVSMFGRWGSGNVRNTGANAVTLSDSTNYMLVELPYSDNSGNATPVLPTGFSLGKKCTVSGVFGLFDSGTGFPTLKSWQQNDVVTLIHHGDSGAPSANVVGFHSHAKTAGTTFDVQVTTTIVYQPTSMVLYWLEISDNVGTYVMFGRIVNGTVVKADDSSGKTVTASDTGGFLKLNATSFSHPSSTYTCKGVVRHA